MFTRRRQTRAKGAKQRGDRTSPEPGGVRDKGAEDEKVFPSGRRRRCTRNAGTVSRPQDGQEGASAGTQPPWDVAFGAVLTSDYNFRGITQSNHKPAVIAYWEPRYNPWKDMQLYAGIGGASISFPNRAAAEIDFYAGFRPTFGALALDFGAWYYWYPGGQCFNAAQGGDCLTNADPVTLGLPVNGNVIKSNLSFWEVYAKAALTVNEQIHDRRRRLLLAVRSELGRRRHLRGRPTSSTPRRATPCRTASGSMPRPKSATGTSEPRTASTAPAPADRASCRIRTAFRTRATPPGTSASASPRACSRWTCATTTPT